MKKLFQKSSKSNLSNKNAKYNKRYKSTNYKYLWLVFSFAFFAVAGFSIITNNNQPSIGSTSASAQEPADINNDNKVDIFDLSTLLSKWNSSDALSDLNKDSIVSIFDLSILLSKWGVVGTNGGDLNYPRIAWEGGPNYWKVSNGSQFAKADAAGWDDPNFFPITIFLGKADPYHIQRLKDAGINTFNPMEHTPDVYPLTNITNAGLFAMPYQGEWTQAEVGNNPNAVGWFISDECDMGYGGGGCADGENAAIAQQTQWVNDTRAKNDGRFVHANFGNGILRTFWSTSTMDQHVALMDSSSADKYTYTSPGVWGIIDDCAGNDNGLAGFQGWHNAPDWPDCVPVARAYSYGWQADQMRRFQPQNDLRPVWTFIETNKPFLSEAGSREITAEQLSGAVWSALRHEARGISYFQHNGFDDLVNCTGYYSIVECNNVHTAVKNVNDKVKSLAPVLNTQSYSNTSRTVNGFTYNYFTFNNGTDTMLKTHNGFAYIFAGLGMKCNNTTCSSGTVDATGNKTFTLPDGVNGTSVEVVGENRTMPVNNRTFSDNFANEYSNHVYKIAL